jgi:hypothetical protein
VAAHLTRGFSAGSLYGNGQELDAAAVRSHISGRRDHRYVGHSRQGKKQLASHDTKPIDLASRLGLKVVDTSDDWIRPKAASPDEGKVRAMTERIKELENAQPQLKVTNKAFEPQPVAYRVAKLTNNEKQQLVFETIQQHVRPPSNVLDPMRHIFNDVEAYEKFCSEDVPAFVGAYAGRLEYRYNQLPVGIHVQNVGGIQAEKLVV